MKTVSFKVAKAIKEAGYPQGPCPFYDNSENLWKDGITDHFCHSYYAPTYIDVWLWLWREKHLALEVYVSSYDKWVAPLDVYLKYDECDDPEEAIVAAIEYLVDHNLIK